MEKKGLRTFDFVNMGLGAIVGVGWALWVNGWIARAGGPLSAFFGYFIAIILLMPVAFCYAELSSIIKVPGGAMIYAKEAFNKKIAFIVGWMLIVVWLGAIAWEVLFLTDIICMLIPGLPSGPVFWTLGGVDVTLLSVVIGVATIIVFMLINIKNAKIVARFQNIATVCLLVLGGISALVMFMKGDFSNLFPVYSEAANYSHESLFGGILTCIVLIPFFMGGMDIIPQGIADADPNAGSKTVGKGVIICVVAAGLFYMMQILACGVALDWHEFQFFSAPAAPQLFFVIFPDSPIIANALFMILLISVVMGLLTTLNACLYGLPRLVVAMSENELLPQWFGRKSENTKAPINAIIFVCLISISCVFLGLGVINEITSEGSFAMLVAWTSTAVCTLVLRKKWPDVERPYKVPGGLPVICLTIIFNVFLLLCLFVPTLPSYMGPIGVKMTVVVIIVGVILHIINTLNRKNKNEF